MARNVNVQKGKQGFQPSSRGVDAPTAARQVAQQQSVAASASSAPDFHAPIHRGMAQPGTPYTGMAVQYRHPDTGDVRTVWAGEVHGVWDGDGVDDPAADILASCETTGDGYLPHQALLTGPHPDLHGAQQQHQVLLLAGGVQRIQERVAKN